MISDQQLSCIKKYFNSQPVLKAYLFGSYARNEQNEKSDIDILVDLDYSKHIGFGFVTMKLDLEEMLHQKVDLVSTKAVSPYIKPFIEQDKVLIYER
jgi:predicted nucleotidyltransferase